MCVDNLGRLGMALEDGQSELGSDVVVVFGADDGDGQGCWRPLPFAEDLLEDPVAFG